MLVILLTSVAYTVLLERKVSGPVAESLGTHAVLDPSAYCNRWLMGRSSSSRKTSCPPGSYRPLYLLAPIIALACALISISVIPFGSRIPLTGWATGFDMFDIADVNIGLLILLGVTSVGVLWCGSGRMVLE